MAASIPVVEEVVDLLDAINRRIRATARQELGPLGVTPAQARALRVLGRSDPPLRMSELADRLGIARRSATSVVDDLADRGLVERHHDGADRRAVTAQPTSAGRALLEELDARRRGAAARTISGLPHRDLTALRDLLRRLDRLPSG